MAKKTEEKKDVKAPAANKAKKAAPEEITATAKFIRMSPYKVRRVANVVRGLEAEAALQTLKNLPHAGAAALYKALHSAYSNAKNNYDLNETLKVSTIQVNEGPMIKRYQPKARGRMYQILKRTCHIKVGVKVLQGSK